MKIKLLRRHALTIFKAALDVARDIDGLQYAKVHQIPPIIA